jgi:uncharacterized protein with HEPN domain
MPERDWQLYVEDIRIAASKIVAYANGLDLDGFVADERTYDAVLRNIEVIGEAASHVPEAVRDRFPQVPWRVLTATRNRLIHGYLTIDDDILWNIVEVEIPALLLALPGSD